jgi:predicted glycosyltransferase
LLSRDFPVTSPNAMSSPAATPSTPLPVQPGGGRRRAWARQRPRVLFYGEGIGLGDRIINVKMANRLMLEIPGASALLMTPAPAELRHRLAPGVDVCELPRIALQTSIGAFEPLSSGADLAGLSRARGEATRRAAEHFNPDLMVVNHSPTGIGKELLPTFKMLRGLAHRPKLVLSLRDILSEPAGVMIASWRSRGEFEAIACPRPAQCPG